MLTLQPKKDGGPNTKFFESAEVLAQLDGVKQWLLKNCKKVTTETRRPNPINIFPSFLSTCIFKHLIFLLL